MLLMNDLKKIKQLKTAPSKEEDMSKGLLKKEKRKKKNTNEGRRSSRGFWWDYSYEHEVTVCVRAHLASAQRCHEVMIPSR